MYHRQIQWAEILVKRHVSKVIVNIEEESVLVVLWWFVIGYPIKLAYKKKS